jgi:hypothetical protein
LYESREGLVLNEKGWSGARFQLLSPLCCK